jgi:hypothetical protein
LDALKQVVDAEASMLELLHGPIDRSSKMCHEFEQSMESFWRKSKTGIRGDCAKMELIRGDINEFIDTISGYKLTISVRLATINILSNLLCFSGFADALISPNAKVSQEILKQYNEMI